MRQADTGSPDFIGAAAAQPLDISRVVVLLDTGLNRLPVTK
jgi:hypothetical protein